MEGLPGDVLTNIHQVIGQAACSNENDEILMFFRGGCFFDRERLTACHSRSPDLELTNFIKLPVNPRPYNTWGSVIGSVEGLICFGYKSALEYVFHIWNPSLSALLALPPWPSDRDSIVTHFRFGFDPKTDDYKVVKLTSLSRMVSEVKVYSTRKGCWELVTQKFPSHITMLRNQRYEVCKDGHLHWVGDTDLEWKPNKTIVAYDLGAKTFREIPLPDSILNHQVYSLKVCRVFAGKLCVMSCVKDGNCEVWVMDEYGVAESWVKHHAFSQFSFNIIPYGFTFHNEFIFRVDNDHYALYDPIANKTKTFKITGGAFAIDMVVEYVDSLVWITPV